MSDQSQQESNYTIPPAESATPSDSQDAMATQREDQRAFQIQSSFVSLNKKTDDISDQLNKLAETIKTIFSARDSKEQYETLRAKNAELSKELHNITKLAEASATEASLDKKLEVWKIWQTAVIDKLTQAVTGFDSTKSTFHHAVQQLNKDTNRRYEVLLQNERTQANGAEDRILESLIYPLHDAAFKISSDIESGGRVVEAQQVCGLLETLESNLRQSLKIRVFRPQSGEKYRIDCMKSVGQEKTALFFRKPDTVARTVACGFYREDGESDSRFLRKASVIVYRNDRSQVISNPEPNPSSTLIRDSSKDPTL